MLMMYVFAAAVPATWWACLRLTGEEFAEKGATATEYAILIGFMAIAIVGGVAAFGTALDGYFGELGAAVSTALN
jgi:Flp pilus assembly pilin Flp